MVFPFATKTGAIVEPYTERNPIMPGPITALGMFNLLTQASLTVILLIILGGLHALFRKDGTSRLLSRRK